MSALTKIFVVLHVVLSLVLVAGMVTFVNRVEDFRLQASKATEKVEREVAAKEAAMAAAVSASADRDNAVREAKQRATILEQGYNQANAEKLKLEGEVADAKRAAQAAAVQSSTAVNAMKSAQEALKASQDAVAGVRKEADDLRQKYAEASTSVSDITNKLDVITRRYQRGQEEIAALVEQIKAYATGGAATALPSGPAIPGEPARPQVKAAPAANNLRGIVRSRKNIQGVEYATISLGSADNVRKGMEFMVIDRTNQQFLGYLHVDSVDTNEATGHLRGPKVGDVRKGNEVITQWQ